MCTVVLMVRPRHEWPLVMAANRDEMADRPWLPPARHWDDRPDVVAGLDELGGGSWLGVNDSGVVAAVLNQTGTLGPAAGRRSRGELVLEALDRGDAVDSASALGELAGASYRGFHLIVADGRDAFLVSGDGSDRPIQVREIPEGVSMVTSHGLNAMESPRTTRHLPLFRAAPPPNPTTGDWDAWAALLASRPRDEPQDGVLVGDGTGYGTVASALIALPYAPTPTQRPIFLFAAGRLPGARFLPVDLSA